MPCTDLRGFAVAVNGGDAYSRKVRLAVGRRCPGRVRSRVGETSAMPCPRHKFARGVGRRDAYMNGRWFAWVPPEQKSCDVRAETGIAHRWRSLLKEMPVGAFRARGDVSPQRAPRLRMPRFSQMFDANVSQRRPGCAAPLVIKPHVRAAHAMVPGTGADACRCISPVMRTCGSGAFLSQREWANVCRHSGTGNILPTQPSVAEAWWPVRGGRVYTDVRT